jgi:hypothetical protein
MIFRYQISIATTVNACLLVPAQLRKRTREGQKGRGGDVDAVGRFPMIRAP